jgi:hypothetical protein
MSSLLSTARVAVIVALALVELSSLFLAPSREALLPLALAQTVFLALAGFLLYRNWWDWFTIVSGMLVLVGVTALALNPDNGFVWPWAMLGLGMAAIMAGNHTCRSASILSARGTSEGGMEAEFHRTAIRGYLRILIFIGLVWMVSLFILLISLNAVVGSIPSWVMAILALMAMVALALLALARRTEG